MVIDEANQLPFDENTRENASRKSDHFLSKSPFCKSLWADVAELISQSLFPTLAIEVNQLKKNGNANADG